MTTREQALKWWSGLFEYVNPSGINKSALAEKYFGKERRYQSLTGSEIEEIWRKEAKTENIYLNRLKEQYKQTQSLKHRKVAFKNHNMCYNAVRTFCLDTQLVSFNDIEVMEDEVNSSF